MKLEHYEMVTNAPIFNTITSLSGSYAAQLASYAGRSTNKVSELIVYLELFMLVNSFRRAAQPTVLFFLPSFDAACHSTSTKTFSSAARRNLRSKFKVHDDTLRSAAKVMYIGAPLRSAKGALTQRSKSNVYLELGLF